MASDAEWIETDNDAAEQTFERYSNTAIDRITFDHRAETFRAVRITDDGADEIYTTVGENLATWKDAVAAFDGEVRPRPLCPGDHQNDGDDICTRCGTNLQGGPRPPQSQQGGPVTFEQVRAHGSAGGSQRLALVTCQITGTADTVESVRALVEAAPALLAALKATLYHETPCERAPECGECAPCIARAAIAQAQGVR